MWTFEIMMAAPPGWLDASGPRADVILSSRVRLARNLEGHVFPNRASVEQLERVRELALSAVSKSNYLKNALVVKGEEARPVVREVLCERHLLDPCFLSDDGPWAAVVGEREVVSAVLNEEDHVRLQCVRSGLQPVDAWRLASRVDGELEQNLHYAFSTDWGYLTACPTNVGTGIRVSALAHLVGLARAKRISQVLGSISKLGLSVRGFHGEGSAALGGFFQISNQTTLGQSEEDVAYTVERVVAQLVGLETEARHRLLSREGARLADEVHRAYGVLSNARLVSSEELMELCSLLRLGAALDLIDTVDLPTLNRLIVVAQPGHLVYGRGGELGAQERDRVRADLVRRELGPRD